MTARGIGRQRLVALFAAGLVALNYPLLALWDGNATVSGLPLFPIALFSIWIALIAAIGLVCERIDD